MRLWPRDGARGVALFFGLFSLLNLIGELRTPGFDANVWWLDLRPLPASATVVILAAAGVLLMWWGLRPAAAAWRRVATPVTAAGLSLVALHNGVTFYRVWEAGRIEPWVPLPLSFVLAAALLCIAWTAARPVPERPDPAVPSQARLPTARSYREGFVQVRIAPPLRRWWSPLLVLTTVVACGILFPLGQQAFFGIDHLRAVDAGGGGVRRPGPP